MIEVNQLTLRQGDFAFEGLSFAVPKGQWAVLQGFSGCGKTTLLEVLCGLRKPTGGRICIDGQDATDLPPGARGIGLVPQDGALFPTMTVAAQVGFPLRLRHWSKAQISKRVAELAEALEMTHLLTRLPTHLSGGERQRVALARALSFHPKVLFLDEPLSALDEPTREKMIEMLRRVHALEPALTVLHVTHSSAEARALGTLSLRLENGKVEVMP